MINILEGYSRNFKIIVHDLLREIIFYFIDVGSNLHYSEIYATVFPLHLQNNEEFIIEQIHRLYRFIMDDYSHNLSSLDEYTLYGVIYFVYYGTDDGFILLDLVTKKLDKVNVEDEVERAVLKNIYDANDLIGICFEDIDFLDVPLYFEWYKKNPVFLEQFAHVDMDFYTDIMPPDILEEYELIKETRTANMKKLCIINSREEFFEAVKNSVYAFNTDITQNKLHEVINGPTGTAGEKIVQRLYNVIAQRDLKHLNILINQEVDTNRGIVDFNLSIGRKYQALVEFKLGNSNQKEAGIKYQLPLYMITEDIDFGIFVLICYSDDIYEEAKKYYDIAKAASDKYKKNILFVRINASGNYKTASKIRNEEEMGLEDWRFFK